MEKLRPTNDATSVPVSFQAGTGDELRSQEWHLAQRVVASTNFARSAFLTNFLLYVCDRKLRGREQEISEYQIGIQALGRPANYHPGEDNIVRNYARMLRKRLEEYFAHEGKTEPIRIVIPRGQYVPVFETNEPQFQEPSLVSQEVEPPSSPTALESRPSRWPRSLLIGAVILVSAISWLSYRRVATKSTSALYHQFWTQIFSASRPSFVVTGDSGFAMLQDMTGNEVHLPEYVTGELDTHFPTLPLASPTNGSFGADRFSNYTSTADLSFVVGLTRLPEYLSRPAKVRYARDMRMDDIKQSNVILIGGPHANPWAELFEPGAAFKMKFPTHLTGQHLDERAVINKQPRDGELKEYSNSAGKAPYNTYTILSFLPSVDGMGWSLLLQGQNMAGTQAAGDFVLDPKMMGPILSKARTSDGLVGPFQVVLETTTVGASAPEAHIVVERYGLQ